METEFQSQVLRRYTDLPALLYLLSKQKITLLDPSSWDDTNDSYYLLKYKEKKKLASVLALCLTQSEETYHHWRVFSSGPGGVCIRFNRTALLGAFSGVPEVMTGPVSYKRVRDAKRGSVQLSVDELPFIKRAGFAPEAEFRVVYSSNKEERHRDFPIRLDSIVEITLSPWLNDRLRKSVKDAIRSIKKCEGLEIHRSSLVGNTTWKNLADSAT